MHVLVETIGLVATLSTLIPAVAGAAPDISDRYIVTLKGDADIDSHMSLLQDLHSVALHRRKDGQTFEGMTHQYNISDFQGYAGHFDKFTVGQLKHHEDIVSIEPDQLWTTASYGLSHISHRSLTSKDEYIYDSSAGTGTRAYVLDTGVLISHNEFEGRATLGYDATDPKSKTFTDNTGHGTHIAALIGGKTYGVAKQTQLIAVKVLDKDKAQLSALLDGFQWAARDITTHHRAAKAVISVTQYGPSSSAFNKAVDAASADGVTTVICAGNDGKNTPSTSGGAKSAITVAATDEKRAKAEFSNWGENVDVFAPGKGVVSAMSSGEGASGKGSGTAQAAAYVAGLVVYFKALSGARVEGASETKEPAGNP
ncbi:subtilisin-like protein [Myriangium duriaei CBS 260.36]|uniref:Subtilisin-like protein n=1 Tax=Myriangium duriaei CBS 260.36 TaxID=1168546 RepID=A0A9P4IV54_9PEZI|nr:subtilisin-like protein [Myriangium duriaei CBS 260.36]